MLRFNKRKIFSFNFSFASLEREKPRNEVGENSNFIIVRERMQFAVPQMLFHSFVAYCPIPLSFIYDILYRGSR